MEKSLTDKEKRAIYYKNHKEKWQIYRLNVNKDRHALCRKKWKEKNKEKIASYRKTKREDTNFRLVSNLRKRVSYSIVKAKKGASAIKDLGCTVEQFKDWLERQFTEGMSWDNYGFGKGKWGVDHEYPLSLIDVSNRLMLLPLVHYTNLQPMWHEENNSKGNRLK